MHQLLVKEAFLGKFSQSNLVFMKSKACTGSTRTKIKLALHFSADPPQHKFSHKSIQKFRKGNFETNRTTVRLCVHFMHFLQMTHKNNHLLETSSLSGL